MTMVHGLYLSELRTLIVEDPSSPLQVSDAVLEQFQKLLISVSQDYYFFTPTMWQCRCIYTAKELTSNIDLTKYQKVQIFYIFNENHWINVILNITSSQILIFDSLAENDSSVDHDVRDFISQHFLEHNKEYNPSQWETIHVVRTGAPLQTNVYDCGIYVMAHMYMDYYNLTQNIPDIQLIRHALLNSFLMGDLSPLTHLLTIQSRQYASKLVPNVRAKDWRHIVWVKLLPSQHPFHKLAFGRLPLQYKLPPPLYFLPLQHPIWINVLNGKPNATAQLICWQLQHLWNCLPDEVFTAVLTTSPGSGHTV